MTIAFKRTIPILRIFSIEKAREFYVDWLGFTVDWEHRFGPDLPLYMQVSRGGLSLHLSEHHGDATPGSAVFIEMVGVETLHREITAKPYRYLKPGIEDAPWGARTLTLLDPFGNRLLLSEPNSVSNENGPAEAGPSL
jgi:catechol 2,3-dioxygenase-like lactoylglutathione lyase family enzyme